MVSFKKLLFLGLSAASLVSAIPHPAPGPDIVVAARDAAPSPTPIANVISEPVVDIEKRIPGRMTLQWSPEGRLLFLLGWHLPQSILDSFYTLGPNGPARALYEDFRQWLLGQAGTHMRAMTLLNQAPTKGGVYDQLRTGQFGFGVATAAFPTAPDMQALLNAIRDWAEQGNALLQVIARPNGFFRPETIGAGELKRDLEERARTDECVTMDNPLQYATVDVQDVDINKDIRWAGAC